MTSLMFREEQVLLAIPVHDEDTLAGTKCRFDGVREPRSILRQELRLHDEAIDDDLDIVLLLLVEDDVVLEGENFAVDSNSREPASTRLLQERFVLSLAFADERCEQLKPGSRPETADLFDDLSATSASPPDARSDGSALDRSSRKGPGGSRRSR